MNISRLLLVSATLCLLAGHALAAEEITGREGRSAMVDVLETTKDSLTVVYNRGDTTIKMKVPAKSLMPHSFYQVRLKHMEDTAENHVALARFCYENNLLPLAKKHLDLAIATDPEWVEQRKAEVPDLVEKFTSTLLADAKELAAKSDYDSAELALSILLEAFPETKAAVEGHALLASMADEKVKQEEAAHAAKIERLQDEAAKKAARDRAAILDPVVKARAVGRKLVRDGLAEENQSKAKGLFDQAIPQYKQTLGMIESLVKLNAGNAELLAEAEELRVSLVTESVHAHCLAGGIALSRSSYGEANEYGNRALAIDPESAEAQSFLVRVQNAISNKDDIDVRSRRPRGGRR